VPRGGTTITYRIDVAKHTVVHDGFAAGSEVLLAVSEGRPAVLSGLETLLETGSAPARGQGDAQGAPCKDGCHGVTILSMLLRKTLP
jgi:hypothetical protein